MGQLQTARTEQAKATTDEEQAKQRLTMHQNGLKTAEAEWKKAENDGRAGKKRIEQMQGVVAEWKKKLEGCDWSQEKQNEGEEQLMSLQVEYNGQNQVSKAHHRAILL